VIEKLEQQLDSFNRQQRKDALAELCEMVKAGEITLPEPGTAVNIHCHSFFSFNSYGYSPTKIAWLARKKGLAVAGTVDFDVLDALDEFLQAARQLDLKACAGMETRVFLPEFATRVMNSPSEPGISYHMGVGFPDAKFQGGQKDFAENLREIVRKRNISLIERVNKYLSPAELDYQIDVLKLTPSGNATERHICLAYARKAQEIFNDQDKLEKFWSEKLKTDSRPLALPEGMQFLNAIRAKTMKRGGIGYVQPDAGSFLLMAEFNQFCLAAGAIPTATWLNGLSEGERAIEELLEIGLKIGSAALNIIPDRNYTPGVKDELVKNLYHVVELAEKLDLPLIVGTEMNSPGQKFVDDFASDELKPLAPIFLKGAHIAYAHSVLQRECGLGYTSRWAKKNFESTAKKNVFFEMVGACLKPMHEDCLAQFGQSTSPQRILDVLIS
jgi:hypothetical protein